MRTLTPLTVFNKFTLVLLDTGAQVSIISLQELTKCLTETKLNKIKDLLDPGAKLELTTANGTVLPYLGWVNVKCELKGDTKGTSIIDLPMLVTESPLDHPIIGYNVLEQLVSKCDTNSKTEEIISVLSDSLPDVVVGNLNSLVDSIRSGSDPYLCSVKTGKRDIIIPAGEAKKVACRINTGFVDRGTPVIFESDVSGSLPNGIEIEDSLLYLKGGNCVKVNLVVADEESDTVIDEVPNDEEPGNVIMNTPVSPSFDISADANFTSRPQRTRNPPVMFSYYGLGQPADIRGHIQAISPQVVPMPMVYNRPPMAPQYCNQYVNKFTPRGYGSPVLGPTAYFQPQPCYVNPNF